MEVCLREAVKCISKFLDIVLMVCVSIFWSEDYAGLKTNVGINPLTSENRSAN